MGNSLYPGYNSGSAPAPGPRRTPATGTRVLGVAGGGLINNPDWAVNAEVAEIGRKGEIRTATVLDPLSSFDGAAVLHDLKIPIPGFTANIDHIVVSGKRVLIIDTKVWRPGFFWTMGGKSYRGMKRFPSAEKKTVAMAFDSLSGYLLHRHIQADFKTPLVAVWPSRAQGRSRFWALNFPGARVIDGSRLERQVQKFIGRKPADEMLVAALSALLTKPPPHRVDPYKYTTEF